MNTEQGRPDWAAAIAAAQSRLPVVTVPELAAERTRRAMAAFGANPPAADGEAGAEQEDG